MTMTTQSTNAGTQRPKKNITRIRSFAGSPHRRSRLKTYLDHHYLVRNT